ncbi:2355_t:CDS:10, partial [Acaulospora morrowiae]
YEEDYFSRRGLLQARAVVSITISTFVVLVAEMVLEIYSLFSGNNNSMAGRLSLSSFNWPFLLAGILIFAVLLYYIPRGKITITQAAKIGLYYFLLISTHISLTDNGFQTLSHANFFAVPPFGSYGREAIPITVFSIGWIICDIYMLCFMYFLFAAYEQEFQLNQERMQKNLEEAKSASTAKSMFISNVSHELRTPLHGILATVEILAKTKLNESQRSLLNTIESCGTNLISVINQVLTYARIEHGKLELEQNPFDIYALMQEIGDGLAPISGRKDLDFVIYGEINPLHRFFKGDLGVLRQIILNLLGNAIKFTDKGRIELIITELTDDEKNHMRSYEFEDSDVVTSNSVDFLPKAKFRIEVVDTGRGIAPDFMNNLYQPFSQEDASLRRKFEGTGLGLSIVKGFLEMMNSRLEVESKLGVGSKFSFALDVLLSPVLNSTPSSSLPFDHQYLRLLLSEQRKINEQLRSLSYVVLNHRNSLFCQRVISYLDKWRFSYSLMDEDELKRDCEWKHADIVILNYSLNNLKHFLDEFITKSPTVEKLRIDESNSTAGKSRIDEPNPTSEKSKIDESNPTAEKLRTDEPKREQRILFFSTVGDYQEAEDILKSYRSRSVIIVLKPAGPTKILNAIIKAVGSLRSSSDQPSSNEHVIPNETGPGGELILSPSMFGSAAITEENLLVKKMEINNDARIGEDQGYGEMKHVTQNKDVESYMKKSEEKPEGNEDLSFLIVEDNKINAMILITMLKQAGYHNYDIAVNGLEAIEKFAQKHYDIIFMDLQMPICDGIEATREIRKIENGEGSSLVSVRVNAYTNNNESDKRKGTKRAIIVAMTGLASYEGAGCDEFLTKPISLKTLNLRMKFWTQEVRKSQWKESDDEQMEFTNLSTQAEILGN